MNCAPEVYKLFHPGGSRSKTATALSGKDAILTEGERSFVSCALYKENTIFDPGGSIFLITASSCREL